MNPAHPPGPAGWRWAGAAQGGIGLGAPRRRACCLRSAGISHAMVGGDGTLVFPQSAAYHHDPAVAVLVTHGLLCCAVLWMAAGLGGGGAPGAKADDAGQTTPSQTPPRTAAGDGDGDGDGTTPLRATPSPHHGTARRRREGRPDGSSPHKRAVASCSQRAPFAQSTRARLMRATAPLPTLPPSAPGDAHAAVITRASERRVTAQMRHLSGLVQVAKRASSPSPSSPPL
jgi:hypothetical protein